MVVLSLLALGGTMVEVALGQPLEPPPAITGCGDLPLTADERRLIGGALLADDPAAGVDAFADAVLLSEVERLAALQLGQRLRPSRIDRNWTIEPLRRDVPVEFCAARRAGTLAAWLESLEPTHAGYRALGVERRRYQAIVQAGGWAELPRGRSLQPGDEDDQVELLRARLLAEGYALPPSAAPRVFDSDMDTALRTFQRRHDLDEDGVLGTETRRALNVSAADRLARIEANLERWRWLPRHLPPDRVEIDAGAAEAVRFAAGQPVLQMRAIVGSPARRTPMFASDIQAVVFNPPWNVPASIARGEILPRAARDPGYLARNGYVRTPGGLQQRPGPGNALGFVKFDFPSPFGVYLHDTSARALFVRRVRTLSHGCVRLEKPRELAADLLAPQGWTAAVVDRVIATGVTRRVGLDTTVPLFVLYHTVSVDEAGRAVFRPDPYGWDAKLLAALASADR